MRHLRRNYLSSSKKHICFSSLFVCGVFCIFVIFHASVEYSPFYQAQFSKSRAFPFSKNSLDLRLSRATQRDFCDKISTLLDGPPLRTRVLFGENSSVVLSRIDDIQFRLANHTVAGVGHNLVYNIYAVEDDVGVQDTVSQFISKEKEWESYAVMSLMEQMEKYRLETGRKREDLFFVDIGANIGTFTIPIAQAGFSVLAFEGFSVNQRALRLSICANKGLADRVTLFSAALGKESASCALYSPDGNILNGNIACDGKTPPGMVRRHDVKISRLDDVLGTATIKELAGRIAGLKLDAEGYEPWILAGGSDFIRVSKPPYMYTEINSYALETNIGSSGEEYLRQLRNLHYLPSITFGGPYLSEQEMAEKGYTKDSNLFFTRVNSTS